MLAYPIWRGMTRPGGRASSRRLAMLSLRVFRTAMLLALLTSGIPYAAFAQVTTGDITGRVTDTSGQVVPGVTVTATNPDLKVTRTVKTNNMGEYTIALLPPGVYTLSAEHAGFKKALLDRVTVNVGTRQTAILEL